MRDGGFRFDEAVPSGGYAWWYVDGLSDDGRHGITLIFFIGSVFSPYYFDARRGADADPLAHCAVNVCLYGPRKHWAMTERSAGQVHRDRHSLAIGRSSLRWDGEAFVIEVDEVSTPFRRSLRGSVRVVPAALSRSAMPLDGARRHWWQSVAPAARIEVALEEPGIRWSGEGYVDQNAGEAPLESAFRHWTWSRGRRGAETVVFYDVVGHDGPPLSVSLAFDRSGIARPLPAPPALDAARTWWGLSRGTHGDAGSRVTVVKTLEDGPFYARSILAARIDGEEVTAMHESLSLRRFSRPWVQFLLPYRMPRSDKA